ncbi:MAG: hypothetical protein MOB07_02735 [Acidobacteria bacterium]|nr:hypothetical protein [Acidobacteriota bacterium]
MDVLKIILPSICGAFFGALLALLATMWRESKKQRNETTKGFIDEFFSTSFLRHRIAVSTLRRKVLSGTVSIESIASGFWYPGSKDSYTGEQVGDFNEHQHLTAYLNFLTRLAHAHSRKQINVSTIKAALESPYIWHGDLTSAVAEEIRKQVSSVDGAILPNAVIAVEAVNGILGYDYKSTGRIWKQLIEAQNVLQEAVVEPTERSREYS